jgi:hypothetical protein
MSSRGTLGEVMYVCMHGPTRLHLMTGCRQGEWSACLRSYVDLKQTLLVLPANVYKSDHDSADRSERGASARLDMARVRESRPGSQFRVYKGHVGFPLLESMARGFTESTPLHGRNLQSARKKSFKVLRCFCPTLKYF